MSINAVHTPILTKEIMDCFSQTGQAHFIDATCGEGGHSSAIIDTFPESSLICIDRDPEILSIAEKRLSRYPNRRITFKNGTFDQICHWIPDNFKADGILADLGISMFHFRKSNRGFSYQDTGPLDMRLEPESPLSASDIVNNYPEKDLADLIYLYGEERFSRRIASNIVRQRPVQSPKKLSDIILKSYPPRKGKRHGPHPATRTFQALRIAVNSELDILKSFIPQAFRLLAPSGVLAVISFHSLEDRIVKHTFKETVVEYNHDDSPVKAQILTKKPVIPSSDEVKNNPASRSAKLRFIMKMPISQS